LRLKVKVLSNLVSKWRWNFFSSPEFLGCLKSLRGFLSIWMMTRCYEPTSSMFSKSPIYLIHCVASSSSSFSLFWIETSVVSCGLVSRGFLSERIQIPYSGIDPISKTSRPSRHNWGWRVPLPIHSASQREEMIRILQCK
jgi:hypothetical protein